jgi:glutamyl-tRNA reductase
MRRRLQEQTVDDMYGYMIELRGSVKIFDEELEKLIKEVDGEVRMTIEAMENLAPEVQDLEERFYDKLLRAKRGWEVLKKLLDNFRKGRLENYIDFLNEMDPEKEEG